MNLPPIPSAPAPHCTWAECTHKTCAVDGYHQATILIIPEPGIVLGAVNIQWNDSAAQAYWNRHVDGRWTLGLTPLPLDPPAEIAREVAIGRGLLAKHTPARELVSAR